MYVLGSPRQLSPTFTSALSGLQSSLLARPDQSTTTTTTSHSPPLPRHQRRESAVDRETHHTLGPVCD